jgi:hypothetical protein
LTQLERLWLADTKIGDGAMAIIGRMTQLRQLALDHTAITDDGMTHLRSLGNLEYLSITRTEATDRGLAVLRALPSLSRFCLSVGHDITDKDVNELQSCLPQCVVDRHQAQ